MTTYFHESWNAPPACAPTSILVATLSDTDQQLSLDAGEGNAPQRLVRLARWLLEQARALAAEGERSADLALAIDIDTALEALPAPAPEPAKAPAP